MIKHWLYGDINLKKEITNESNCSECIHFFVCNINYSLRCINFVFGSSVHYNNQLGCENCLNRYPKVDTKQPIKCFSCKDYLELNKNN
jgi:hypothetical protein